MVSTLVRNTGKLISRHVPKPWRWNDGQVCLVDGTTIRQPDTAANQIKYPHQKMQKPGLGNSISRIVAIICLSSGTILNSALSSFKGKSTGEQTLFRSMLDTLSKVDVVLGDAIFCDYFTLASLRNMNVDAVFERMGARKRLINFRKGERLGSKDHLISLPNPKNKPKWMTIEEYRNAPDALTIRELEIKGKVLITMLLSLKLFPKHELKALYKSRWHIELDLRNIKTTLGMETLSCKTPDMIEKKCGRIYWPTI